MILLKDIIDEFMLRTTDPDNYAHGVGRTLALKYAKRAFEDIAYAAIPSVETVQFELPAHKTLEWPVGAIDIISLSIVDKNGQLTPIYFNDRNPICKEYILDNEGKYITDGSTGLPIKAFIDPAYPQPNESGYDALFLTQYGRRYGLRGGYEGRAGTYKYDQATGRFHFFQLPTDTPIIFEYLVSPLLKQPDAELSIHEYARESVEARIYYEVVKQNRSVPYNEKERSRREYYHELKKAKKRMLIKPDEIIQAFRRERAVLKY